jgi:PAS domain S-box-containing protein
MDLTGLSRFGDSGETAALDVSRFVRDFPGAVLVADATGAVLAVSDAVGQLVGASGDEIVGASVSSFLSGDDFHAHVAYLLETAGDSSGSGPVPARIVHADASYTDVEVRVGLVDSGPGGRPLIVTLLQTLPEGVQVGEPEEVWHYFHVAVRLADQLSSVTDPGEAVGRVLPIVFPGLGWDVACLWLVGPDRRRLLCAATWPDEGGWTLPFEDASRGIRLRVGEGLPGSAWGSGRPLVSSVAVGENRLLRQDAIRACGLQTGLAFPLVTEAGVVGVIEMFARRSQPMSLRLLEGLSQLGGQIGQLLDHVRAESRLREEERIRSFLLEAATVLSASSGYGDALGRLAALAVPEMADICLIDVKESDGTIVRMAAVHADPAKADLVAELGALYPPEVGGPHPSTDVMATGESRWSPTMTEDYLRATTRDDRHFRIVRQLGFESYMSVPLQDGDDILGAITLVSAGSGRRYGPADLALPEELARRATAVVASARRHDLELQVSHQLQRLLLPDRLPDVAGFELGVRYTASAPLAETGGDFYDVIDLPDERVGLLIGDVEGHDTLAAGVMGQLRSATRALAGQAVGPRQLLDALRGSWQMLGFERFATMQIAFLDPRTGHISLVSAGHLPPIHLRPGQDARFVPVRPSPPLGVAGAPAQEEHVTLEPGEAMFFYTDGLVEQRATGLDTRLAQLAAVLQSAPDGSADELCGHAINTFDLPQHRQEDDVAVMTIKRCLR